MKTVKVKVLLVLVLVAFLVAACGKDKYWRDLAWGYRAVNASAKLGEAFDRNVKKALAVKLAECQKAATPPVTKPPTDAEKKTARIELAKCMMKVVKVSRAWTGEKRGKRGPGVLPTLQAAQKSARAALDGAHDHKQKLDAEKKKCGDDAECKKKVSAWQVPLKAALCAAVPLIDEGLAVGVPKFADGVTYKLVKGLVTGWACKGGK